MLICSLSLCVVCLCLCVFFFFKQKTAYEMRISDWSSDVCSSVCLAGDEAWQAAPDHAVDGVPVERAQGFAADRPVRLDGRSYLRRLSLDGRVQGSQVTRFVPRTRTIGRRDLPLHPIARRGHCELRHAACVDMDRSEEHTSELQSLMRISYAVFCLKKKKTST